MSVKYIEISRGKLETFLERFTKMTLEEFPNEIMSKIKAAKNQIETLLESEKERIEFEIQESKYNKFRDIFLREF